VCVQILIARNIGFIRRLTADHLDASNQDSAASARVCLHFFQVLSNIVDEVCEGLDDLLPLIDDIAWQHDDDDALQDGALQASLGLRHRQVVCVCCTRRPRRRLSHASVMIPVPCHCVHVIPPCGGAGCAGREVERLPFSMVRGCCAWVDTAH
jgi:hypothetical protein